MHVLYNHLNHWGLSLFYNSLRCNFMGLFLCIIDKDMFHRTPLKFYTQNKAILGIFCHYFKWIVLINLCNTPSKLRNLVHIHILRWPPLKTWAEKIIPIEGNVPVFLRCGIWKEPDGRFSFNFTNKLELVYFIYS